MTLRFNDIFRFTDALARATGWDELANENPAFRESGAAIEYDDNTDVLLPTGRRTRVEWFGSAGKPGLRAQVLAQGVSLIDVAQLDRQFNESKSPNHTVNITESSWRHIGPSLHPTLQRFEDAVVLRRPEGMMTSGADARWTDVLPKGPILSANLAAGAPVLGATDSTWYNPARLAHTLSILTHQPREEIAAQILEQADGGAQVAWPEVRRLLDEAGFEDKTVDAAVRERQRELGVVVDGKVGRRTTTADRAVTRVAEAVRDSEAIQSLLSVPADASLAEVRARSAEIVDLYARWAERTEGVTNFELKDASPAHLAAFIRSLEDEGFASAHPELPPDDRTYSSAAVAASHAKGVTTVPGATVMVPGFQHIAQMSSRGGESGNSLYCYRAVMAMAHAALGNARDNWSDYRPDGPFGVRKGLGSPQAWGDHAWIRSQLENGIPVLLGADRPGGKNLGIGGADHAMMIVGIDNNGNYIVANPGSSTHPLILIDAGGRQLDANGQPNGYYTARNVIPFNVTQLRG